MSVQACWAVVVAAGVGSRMGEDRPKQYLTLHGRPVLEWTLEALARLPDLSGIVLVTAADDPYVDSLTLPANVTVTHAIGGATRADSVLSGLRALARVAAPADLVMVHDAARPCVIVEDLESLLSQVRSRGRGAILATPLSDTLKQVDEVQAIVATRDRSALWRAQTPQLFALDTLTRALADALSDGVEITDEASAMEWAGQPVDVVAGSTANIKITVPADLAFAAHYLQAAQAAGADRIPREDRTMTGIRIGHGYDVHRFGVGDHVVLGGIRIEHSAGLEAHSDGDVLIHALCDALLGAIGRGDIGRHFPDTDPAFAGADSRDLLRGVLAQVHNAGWQVANIDSTLIAQAPKMAPHIDVMRDCLAADLQVDVSVVNVKATTTERLGFAGREEGIAAHAVVSLVPR